MRLEAENQQINKKFKEEKEKDSFLENKEALRKETERRISERIAENAQGHGDVVNTNDLIVERAVDSPKNPQQKPQIVSERLAEMGIGSTADLRKLAGFRK